MGNSSSSGFQNGVMSKKDVERMHRRLYVLLFTLVPRRFMTAFNNLMSYHP